MFVAKAFKPLLEIVFMPRQFRDCIEEYHAKQNTRTAHTFHVNATKSIFTIITILAKYANRYYIVMNRIAIMPKTANQPNWAINFDCFVLPLRCVILKVHVFVLHVKRWIRRHESHLSEKLWLKCIDIDILVYSQSQFISNLHEFRVQKKFQIILIQTKDCAWSSLCLHILFLSLSPHKHLFKFTVRSEWVKRYCSLLCAPFEVVRCICIGIKMPLK